MKIVSCWLVHLCRSPPLVKPKHEYCYCCGEPHIMFESPTRLVVKQANGHSCNVTLVFRCQGNFEDGCRLCPEGTYRGTAQLFTTRSCVECPANSWSLATVSFPRYPA